MRRSGFTLIELLVVVAILGILATIAIPNFLEAQTRAKEARVKTDHRTLATALEAYRVDANDYPPEGNPAIAAETVSEDPDAADCLIRLTTPVAYLTSTDATDCPFISSGGARADNGQPLGLRHYFYTNYLDFAPVRAAENAATVGTVFRGWGLSSLGPDRTDNGILWDPVTMTGNAIGNQNLYDPTNGTTSRGDIPRFGGDLPSTIFARLNPR